MNRNFPNPTTSVYPQAPLPDDSNVMQQEKAAYPLTEEEYIGADIFRVPLDNGPSELTIYFQNALLFETHVFIYPGEVNVVKGQELSMTPLAHLTANGKGGLDWITLTGEYSVRGTMYQTKQCGTKQGQQSQPVKLQSISGSVSVKLRDGRLVLTPTNDIRQLAAYQFDFHLLQIPAENTILIEIFDNNKLVFSVEGTGKSRYIQAIIPDTFTAIVAEKACNLGNKQKNVTSEFIVGDAFTVLTLGQTIVSLVQSDVGTDIILNAYNTNKLTSGLK